jgi:hypothetical protein
MSGRRLRSDVGIAAAPHLRTVDPAHGKQPSTRAEKLAELSRSLPEQIHAAAQAISIAERDLADVLTLRATGHAVKGSKISAARMALARALRHAEDLQRIRGALPAALRQA